MSERSPLPPNLPYPVVFGPSFPQFTMVTKGGRQTFRSRTNQNLFLNEWDFNKRGTLTMARLLRLTSRWEECWPLLWDALYGDPEGHLEDWGRFLDEPAWSESEAFARLLGFSQWDPERHFFLEWCKAQYRRDLEGAYDRWSRRSKSWRWEVPIEEMIEGFVFDLLDLVFDFPALIPETWLNYLGPEKTEADERHLAENPSRVDFVVFAAGRKYVIEIDGPSHYADFDEDSRTYSINQHKYAKNLAIERSLRRQGWEIYRFANVEMAASGEDFVGLLTGAQLPGLIWVEDPLTFIDENPAVGELTLGKVLESYIREGHQ